MLDFQHMREMNNDRKLEDVFDGILSYEEFESTLLSLVSVELSLTAQELAQNVLLLSLLVPSPSTFDKDTLKAPLYLTEPRKLDEFVTICLQLRVIEQEQGGRFCIKAGFFTILENILKTLEE